MNDEIDVRPAHPDDASAIVDIIRAGFDPARIQMFIYGCAGVERYVSEQIAGRSRGGDSVWTIAACNGEIVGCCEYRTLRDRLFLNYIAVSGNVRAKGLGRRMSKAGIDAAAGPGHHEIELDVLEGNDIASNWYRSLGFREKYVTEWWTIPIEASEVAPGGRVKGLPQATACHEAFGFSRVTIETSKDWDVGVLGTRFFRLSDPEALTDRGLLSTLRMLDPQRTILAMLPKGPLAQGAAKATRVFATHRLGMDLATLRSALDARPV